MRVFLDNKPTNKQIILLRTSKPYLQIMHLRATPLTGVTVVVSPAT